MTGGLFGTLDPEERDSLVKTDAPPSPKPMLAVLVDEAFSDPDWIFERKLDGERVLAILADGEVRLISRNGLTLNPSYPELVDALEARWAEVDGSRRPAMVLDGEVVAFSDNVTSFSRLQERMHIRDPDEARDSPVKVYFYLFDLLHLDGFGLVPVSEA